jgi:integrase
MWKRARRTIPRPSNGGHFHPRFAVRRACLLLCAVLLAACGQVPPRAGSPADEARPPVPAAWRTELAKLWLQSKGRLTAATKDQYGTAVRFWTRMFGANTPVGRIDHKVAEAKIGSFHWKSAKQHNNYMIALRGIFGMEYRGTRAALAPVAEIENMPVVKKKPDPLTRGERDRVLAEMKARFDERVYAYFLFAFSCGMRPEEIIALRWGDIDFAAGTARVQRVRTFRGAERDGSKTNCERDVDLVPQALEALGIMRAHTGERSAEVFRTLSLANPGTTSAASVITTGNRR